jgi:hypothetical protein
MASDIPAPITTNPHATVSDAVPKHTVTDTGMQQSKVSDDAHRAILSELMNNPSIQTMLKQEREDKATKGGATGLHPLELHDEGKNKAAGSSDASAKAGKKEDPNTSWAAYILSHDHSRDIPGKDTSPAGQKPPKDGGDNSWAAYILSHDHSRDMPKAAPAK